MADSQCYASLIAACHRAGRHREAKRVFTSAINGGQLKGDDLKRVKIAHCRSRRSDGTKSPGVSIAA
jgi:pentatricopeptide repeat protein